MRLTLTLFSRYFKRYIERNLNETQKLKREWKPFQGWVEDKRKEFFYDENRPWTEEFRRNNMPHTKHKRIPLQPVKDWNIFKGDIVQLMVGKDKGKQGVINCIIKERNWCFIEGLNCEYKEFAVTPGQRPHGHKDEKPLLITTQVKLIDPEDRRPTEVEWRYTEDGERVRVSQRTGRIIPVPSQGIELEDGIVPENYQDNPITDTYKDDVVEVTFKPKLKSFEQEICEEMGLEYTKPKRKTYWY